MRRLSAALLLTTISFVPRVARAQLTGFQEYVVPGAEDGLHDIFRNMSSSVPPTGPMHSVIAITAGADGTVVYYDHWENGYAANPTQADEIFTLDAGQSLILESSNIAYPRNASQTCGTGKYCYDGGDRIYTAGRTIAVTRASWPETPGPSLAVLWELYPVLASNTQYVVPVGENFAGAPKKLADFNTMYVIATSEEDGNQVNFHDTQGTYPDLTITLNKGQSNGGGNTFRTGGPALVRSLNGKKLEVSFVGGINQGGNDDTRSLNVIPTGLYGTDYFSPLPGFANAGTQVFAYNPNAFPITVHAQDSQGSYAFNVPANDTVDYKTGTGHYVPIDSAPHLFTTTASFWAFGLDDAAGSGLNSNPGSNWDWTFNLVNTSLLSDTLSVPWGPGSTGTPPSQNGSPVWITPAQDDTFVFVDLSPGDGIDDQLLKLNRGDVAKIYDPDKDNSGTRIRATGKLAVAYGEDPSVAGTGSPYLDLGYSLPPLLDGWVDPVLGLTHGASPATLGSSGGITTVAVDVSNFNYAVSSLTLAESMPIGWSYVSGSTTITYPDGSTLAGAAADPAIAGRTLSWAPPNATLTNHQHILWTFQVQTGGSVLYGPNRFDATATGVSQGITWKPTEAMFVTLTPPATVIKSLYLHPDGTNFPADGTPDLDRFQPNAGADTTTTIADGASASWTLVPALSSALGTPSAIHAKLWLHPVAGTGGNPDVTVTLKAGTQTLGFQTLSKVASALQLYDLSITPESIAVAAGQKITLTVSVANSTTGSCAVAFNTATHASRVDIATYSYIKLTDAGAYSAAYPAGSPLTLARGQTVYARATFTDPFGVYDITSPAFATTRNGSTISSGAPTAVAASGGTIVYEVPHADSGNATLVTSFSAKEGTENLASAAGAATWTVDTVAPTTSITGGPNGLVATSAATFTYSSSESGSTFQCKLDSGAFTGCAAAGASYSGLAQGGHTFQVAATDPAGNTDAAPPTRSWTVDTIAPTTSITGGPSAGAVVASTNASFTYTSNDGTASFLCSLDGAAFAACASSGRSYSSLSQGSHTFTVEAKDPAGNVDPAPPSRSWTVDTIAPTVSIGSGPADGSTTGSTIASFTYSASESATFTCSLDGAAFSPCSASGITYNTLSNATHVFKVAATDVAGNLSNPVAQRSWTVDNVFPATSITSGPADGSFVSSTSASFTYSSSKAGSTFKCSRDGAALASCATTGIGYTGLSQGSHTFTVVATDTVGNTDPSPPTRTWTVDTIAPVLTITGGPANGAFVSSTSLTFTYSSNEPGSTFECSVNGAALSPCPSGGVTLVIPPGTGTIEILAVDPAGNQSVPYSITVTADDVPPITSIDAGPANLSFVSSTSASFSYSANETASFRCSLDLAPSSPCPSGGIAYGALSQGTHSFVVEAVDQASNVDPNPPSRSWTVDTIPPATTITSGPLDGSAVSSTNAAFTYDASEPATFRCSLDGAPFASCGAGGSSFTALSQGSHLFQVEAVDDASNVDPAPPSRTWTVDTIAPVTSIDAGPANGAFVSSTNATFAWSANEASVQFLCSLDGSPFAPCPSAGTTLTGLAQGIHGFVVEAVDAASNVDPNPPARIWTVDTIPPSTTIVTGPADGSDFASTSAAFTYSASEPATYACSLDGAAFTTCDPAGVSYANLAQGSHLFQVEAIDDASNVDPAPPSRAWTVDTIAPTTTITSGPATGSYVASAAATFDYSSNETGVTFECSLDGATLAPCNPSSEAYSGLAEGSHTFTVVAVDGAGNADPNPQTRTWVVDTVPPSTGIASGPATGSFVSSTTAAFTYQSNETGAGFECRLDAAAFASCDPAGASYPNLAQGAHTFSVRAVDLAGNVDPSPPSRAWTVDTVPPSTQILTGPSGPTGTGGASFTYQSNETGATFLCSLDGATPSSCAAGGQSYSGLALGRHTFQVVSIDRAGNVDPNPPTRAWSVEYSALGSGCSCDLDDHASGSPLAAIALAIAGALVMLARRRVLLRRPRGAAIGVAALAAASLARPASAQTSRSIDLEQFRPADGAHDVLAVQSAETPEPWEWHLQAWLDYGSHPLRAADPVSGATLVDLVSSRVDLDLGGTIGIAKRVELSAVLPLMVYQATHSAASIDPSLSSTASTGMSDLRVTPKVKILDEESALLAVAIPISLPTGNANAFAGSGGATASPRVVGEYHLGAIRAMANLGAAIRQQHRFLDTDVGNAITYAAAAEAPFRLGGREVAVMATIAGEWGLAHQGNGERPLELLAGARWEAKPGLTVSAGGGPGLSSGLGTPAFRVFAGAQYAFGKRGEASAAPEATLAPIATPAATATPISTPAENPTPASAKAPEPVPTPQATPTPASAAATPAPTPVTVAMATPDSLSLVGAQMCKSISADHAAVNPTSTFSVKDDGKVYLWLSLAGPVGSKVHVVWYKGKAEIDDLDLTLPSATWRTQARKTLHDAQAVGDWHVEIRVPDGKKETTLQSVPFQVVN